MTADRVFVHIKDVVKEAGDRRNTAKQPLETIAP